MKVRSGAKPNGKLIEVELDESDMADVEGWNQKLVGHKWQIMTKRADKLLVEYMMRNEDISKEYGMQRIKEIDNA